MAKESDIFSRLAREGAYERDLIRIVEHELPRDRDAVDIGANIGLWTVFLAKTIGQGSKVLSCEPVLEAWEYLSENIQINGLSRKVILRKIALSNEEGTAQIRAIPGKTEYSTLGMNIHPNVQNERVIPQCVEVSTLDALIAETGLKPGFIKVDVEGMELHVVRGAAKTLERFMPLMLIEINKKLAALNGWKPRDLISLLQELGYNQFIDPEQPTIPPHSLRQGNLLCRATVDLHN